MNTSDYPQADQVRRALRSALALLANTPGDAPVAVEVIEGVEQTSLHIIDMSPVATSEDVIEGWFRLADVSPHGVCREPKEVCDMLATGCDTAWDCPDCGQQWVTEITGQRTPLHEFDPGFHLPTSVRTTSKIQFPPIDLLANCEVCSEKIADGASFMAVVKDGSPQIVAQIHIDCADVHGYTPKAGFRVKRMKARDTAKYPLA